MEEWRIGICDDEPLVQKQLEQMIRENLDKHTRPYHIQAFTSGKELLTFAEQFHEENK